MKHDARSPPHKCFVYLGLLKNQLLWNTVLKLLLKHPGMLRLYFGGTSFLIAVSREWATTKDYSHAYVPSPWRLKAFLRCWNPGQWRSRVSLQSTNRSRFCWPITRAASLHQTYKSGWQHKRLVRGWENIEHTIISQITGPASRISYIFISVVVQVRSFL